MNSDNCPPNCSLCLEDYSPYCFKEIDEFSDYPEQEEDNEDE